jgi:hypothetical protein
MDAAEAARNDPLGFYPGMVVKSGKEHYVLSGPERTFTADRTRPEAKPEPAQMEMVGP